MNNRRILCINPAESLEPVVVAQIPTDGRSFLTDLFVTDGGTIYVSELIPKKGVGLPPKQPNFHRSLAVSRWISARWDCWFRTDHCMWAWGHPR